METIFYSWQSDRDQRTNRFFIRDILDAAIGDLNRELAVDEAYRLDHDTKGEPGHPPIFQTILKKIDDCRIFVADITYVAETEGKKKVPNPNVLIELGYALKVVGYSRFILVMNTAYGGLEDLPFDFRQYRRPISYELPPDSGRDAESAEKKHMTQAVAGAIKAIIALAPAEEEAIFNETPSTGPRSIYFKEGEPIATEYIRFDAKRISWHVPSGAKLYLRFLPTRDCGVLETEDATSLAGSTSLPPFRIDGERGWNPTRNKYGAVNISGVRDTGEVLSLTQLFRNKELWGIDAFSIRKELFLDRGIDHGCLQGGSLQRRFKETFASYMLFSRDNLKISLPLRFEAGVTGITGYRMAGGNPFEPFIGQMVVDEVWERGGIESYDVEPETALNPFFAKLWRECGVRGP